MKITYEHNHPIHRAIIEKLDDPRYYSKYAIDPEIRGKFMEYGKYHGKPVIITNKISKPYHGINMDKVFILYGKKTKQDVLSTYYYNEGHISVQGLYRGSYADIVLRKTVWEEIKRELQISKEAMV